MISRHILEQKANKRLPCWKGKITRALGKQAGGELMGHFMGSDLTTEVIYWNRGKKGNYEIFCKLCKTRLRKSETNC